MLPLKEATTRGVQGSRRGLSFGLAAMCPALVVDEGDDPGWIYIGFTEVFYFSTARR